MARFEVFVPAAPPRVPMDLTLRLDADHWLGALKAGLQRMGEINPSSNVLCDIRADGSIHVTDPDSGRVFRIAELPAATSVAPLQEVQPWAPSPVAATPPLHPSPARPAPPATPAPRPMARPSPMSTAWRRPGPPSPRRSTPSAAWRSR